jgi:hypothetical protein
MESWPRILRQLNEVACCYPAQTMSEVVKLQPHMARWLADTCIDPLKARWRPGYEIYPGVLHC